jgi:hypothetical protein
MKMIIITFLLICFFFSSFALADELTKEEIIKKLGEISAIENDIARLQAYDEFISNLKIKDSVTAPVGNNIVTEYSGNGMKNTRPFIVSGPWEIQWNAHGDIFQIFLYREDGSLADVAANQMGVSKGSYYNPKAGTYYLQVNAMGKWEIIIIHVK